MYCEIAFIIAFCVFIAAGIIAYLVGKNKIKKVPKIVTPTNVLLVGVVLSAFVLFVPIYERTFNDIKMNFWETLLISAHNVIRLFVVDGDFQFITDNIDGLSVGLKRAYTVFFAILFVLAPFLTFSFVLSFFKNMSGSIRCRKNRHKEMYVFSELNENSVTLATDLYKTDSEGRFFVFTDVSEDEDNNNLIDKIKQTGAVCFEKDILSVDFSDYGKKEALNFFAIGQDSSKNIDNALQLIEKNKGRENINLYVFSTQVESEMLLSNVFDKEEYSGIKLRRVNEVHSLINRTLYDYGKEKVFDTAREDENDKENKRINAIVVGMGLHGTEMTKALAWFCQMDGYKVEINSFDIDEAAEGVFKSKCPELMDDRFNGHYDIDGEAKYKITVHSGIDVTTKSFDDMVEALPRTTYVFVALGDDRKNIETAVKLRSIFARKGYDPAIQAVVYNTDKKEALTGVKNFKKQKYDIDFIGDSKTSYSEKVILGTDLENEALSRHTKWGSEKDFWQYDYNYQSSIASAIHRKMKRLCSIPGMEKAPADRTEEELWNIRKLEHCRWNAYMRSEGYVYGGTVDKEGRNDLAKMHNCLVPFDKLPLKEQEKDDD